MENALALSAMYDPEYRACAKEFFEALLPVTQEKMNTLQRAYWDKYLEFESIKAAYEAEIKKRFQEWQVFKHQINDVLDRLHLTDCGSSQKGGHVPCENPNVPIGMKHPLMMGTDPILWMEGILKAIHEMDGEGHDPEKELEDQIRMLKAHNNPAFSESSGIRGPVSGVIDSDVRTNDGLKGFVKKLFG